MNKTLMAMGLAARLFLVWWLGPALLGGVLGGLTGLGVALLLFFWVAVVLAALGTILQYLAYNPRSLAHSMGAFHRAVIQLAMPFTEVEPVLAELLQEDLGATSLSMGTHHVQALFQPRGWSGWWRRWAGTDELIVEVWPSAPDTGEAGGCTLKVTARPLSALPCGWLWIDRGRNAARLQRLQELLGERMADDHSRKERGRKADSLETRLAQAELLLLRAQVEPHFLFNTLAHLRELVRTGDGAAAVTMLDHLIAYCRSVSDRIRQATQTLEQELEAARGYLSLIQLRYGDRLHFEVQVAPDLLACEVPVGCLMIPIENAIKHGFEPRGTQGRVWVRGRLEGDSLLLEVQDDGPGLRLEAGARSGTGLANLRERLLLLFPRAASLGVEDHEAGGVLVQIRMPVWRRA